MKSTTNQFKSIEEFNVISDIFSQAITGELIGMSNFASLSGTIDDPHEKMEAVEHADSERQHAEGFMAVAKELGLNVKINLNGLYWKAVRNVFLKYSKKNDFIACLIIQEVMLEAYAVAMYTDVGNALSGEAGKLFRSIANEEQEHMDHSTDILRAELERNPSEFIDKFEKVHYDCMNILAEFSATTACETSCDVCQGDCMKKSLNHVDLEVNTMRGNALNLYAKALDNIGIPGEKSTQWIANLPS